MNSVKTSNVFYQKLGAKGMADLSSQARDDAYIKFLTKKLPKQGKILDCACGYGRLTIPLAQKGFEIYGIDLAPNLIKAAKDLAKKEHVTSDFKTGNMCKLPYKDNTFNAVICMWSSFNHLLTEKDQLEAINEMLRVTVDGGLILIDLPNPKSFTHPKTETGLFIDKDKRLFSDTISGVENVEYFHDKKSVSRLLEKVEGCTYSLNMRSIGKGRTRFVVEIVKNP